MQWKLPMVLMAGAGMTLAAAVAVERPETSENALTTDAEVSVERASLYAVRFHADWCRSCDQLEPAFERLAHEFSNDRVLFVTFDLTKRPVDAQSQYLAAALDLETIWLDNGGRTGHVVLIDESSRQPVGRITAAMPLEAQNEELRTALTKVESNSGRH